MTLRAVQSVVVFGVVTGVVVLLLVDLVVKGDWQQTAALAGPAAFGLWAAWLLLVRPSIRVEPDRAVVVNVGRITEIPWGQVADIRRRLQLIVDLDDGRSVEAWGSPFPKRSFSGRDPMKMGDDDALSILRSAWQSAGTSNAAVVRRTDVVALAIGAAAVVALVLSLTVVR